MKQPFYPSQIRRFLLFYAGIVILLMLFFLLNRAFNPVKIQEQKIFSTGSLPHTAADKGAEDQPPEPSRFKLLPK